MGVSPRVGSVPGRGQSLTQMCTTPPEHGFSRAMGVSPRVGSVPGRGQSLTQMCTTPPRGRHLAARQVHNHAQTSARGRSIQPYLAARTHHQPVNNGQAEPRALASCCAW